MNKGNKRVISSSVLEDKVTGSHREDEVSPTRAPSVLIEPSREVRLDPLPSYFEQACDRRPNGVAVICGSSQLTYLELDHRANQLAHLLVERGATTGKTIGILLERSLNTYVALLAVLKAGAAFVPLDPSLPSDRVAFIAEDAGLQDLITISAFREKTQKLSCPILELDEAMNELTAQPETRPEISIHPSSLCYIIYTSGTTGKPKGVAILHSNISNFLRVVTPIYDVTSDDRVYQGMTIAFDFSFEEIWPTWIAAATLVAGPTDSRRLGHGLTKFLIEHSITVLCCVPTLLATIDRDVPSLRSLIVGGEACPADLVRRWYRPERRMLNTYGPTETTVTATWCELLPDRPVTIGTPLPTYRISILDDQLRPVEEGTAGEICIGGPGVSIGYLHRPDLTQDQFVSNPISRDRAEAPRLYRTGDLGRFTSSGEIEYLGRIDTQVKIRGYRIELGEIDAVLREDQAVENAIVKVLEVEGVVQDLAAYVTLRPHDGEATDPDLRKRLHASLRQRLPTYMVPSFIEVLDEFPLLAADKVNRAALPPPTSPRLSAESRSYVPPTTALESQLAAVWGQILHREKVSVEDDFFSDLGGHSLVAALVISQLRQEPELQTLAISDLYAKPTIRQLAQFIEADAALSPHDRLTISGMPAARRHSNVRVLCCGIAQLVILYAFLFVLSAPMAQLPEVIHSQTLVQSLVELGVITFIWLSAISFLLPIVAGPLLMGNIQPGWYPLWGRIYFRWWLYRRILALSPIGLLTGSPLLSPYLRLLGAKIGHGCHLTSSKISLPTFIDMGDGVSTGYGVQLQPFVVDSGWLRLAPIQVGRDVFLGTNTVVLAGAKIGDGAIIAEQSLVPQDHVIPASEQWGGSPSKHLQSISPLLEAMATKADGRRWPISVVAGFIAAMLLLMLFPWLMIAPSVVLVSIVTLRDGLPWGIASTALAGPLFVLMTCILVCVGKRVTMPTVHAGIYSLRSWFGLRKWLSDQMMAMSLGFTNTLYATLYLIPFLRLLGARIGKWSEVSTVAYIDPDMLKLGNESFVADIAMVGPAVFHRGCIALAPAEVGQRSFVGNGALVPGSYHLGNDSLIGVYSVPPVQEVNPGTSWLGSPAIFLPRRQKSQYFSEELTYAPRPRLIACRLVIEFFRVTLPASILALTMLGGLDLVYHMALTLSPLLLLLLFPLLVSGSGMASLLVVVLLKWLIVGRYRPRVEPLWSVFVRRSEFITGLYEAVAVPSLVGTLTGTPWIAPLLRLFGARIGRRVWLDTTYLTEFDLVEVGDDAAIGESTSLQTHLFEDRVMKMSTVKIGAASSVGSRSVVLYDAQVGDGASLEALSLVMKGETLPAGSRWEGIPARAS